MPSNWEDRQLKKTLLIVRYGSLASPSFRLHPYMRVTDLDGNTYMRPLPSGEISLAHQGLVFDDVKFIEPPGSGQYGGGDTFLIHDTVDNEIRLTANS